MKDINNLTEFQRRRLRLVAKKMNMRIRELAPHLKNLPDVFQACVKPGDGDENTYAILPDYDISLDQDEINIVLREFDAEIQGALKFVNPLRKRASKLVSAMMWQVPGLFKVESRYPYFTLKNKSLSPIYFDLGVLISWPGFMNLVSSLSQIEIDMTLGRVDIIIGGESRGIPFSTWLSEMMNQSTGFARKEIKAYGTKQGVEGCIIPDDFAVIMEDMITDGGSKEIFIENVKNAGGVVIAVIVIFDRKQGGEEFLEEKYGIPLISLTDIYTFLEVGLEDGELSKEEYGIIMDYLDNPVEWNKKVIAAVC